MNLQDLPYWGQLLIITGVCLVLGVVFYMFFYQGEVTALNGLKNTLKQKNDEVKKYEGYERNMNQLQAEISRIKEELSTIESLLPTEKDDVELLSFMIQFANEHDISLDRYRSVKGSEADQYFENIIEIEASRGRMHDYLKFFDAIGRKGQILHIHGVTLKKTAAKFAEGERYPVTASFKISSFVYKPPAPEEG